MPTYHYRCADCRHSFDHFQKFSETALTVCPQCSGPVRRVPQPVGIVFKGSGWYVTDSRQSKGNGAGSKDAVPKSDGAAAGTSGSEVDTAKSEPKKAPTAAGVDG